MGWLTGWLYRKSVTLSRASGAVTNYQMRLLVGESEGAIGEDVDCGGKCRTDFNDLRFTTSNGTTLLDYWIESITGTSPNQLATVWIEFDSIGTSATTFYMYYGKSDATSYSNGDNTFPFFDDFSGTFPGTKWTGDTSFASIVSGALRCKGNTSNVEKIIKSASQSGYPNQRLRARVTLYAQNHSYFGLGDYHVARIFWATFQGFDTFDGSNYSWVTSNFTTGSYKILDILIRATVNSRWFMDGSERLNSPKTTHPPNQSMGVWISLKTTSDVTVLDIDWVFLSQYVNNGIEPAWGSWGSEESELPGSKFVAWIN